MSNDILRFPGVILHSAADFRRFRAENSDLLDERYRREQALGSKERHITLEGTCAPCLSVTRFISATAGGMATNDGHVVPNWREQQVCCCRHGLNCRQRGLLQLALSWLGASGWCRVAVLGTEDHIALYLTTKLPGIGLWPGFIGTGSAPADAASVHLVISADHLHRVPPIDASLKEVARVLAPGGCFLFTVPFDVNRETTHSDVDSHRARGEFFRTFSGQPVHQFGWDVLDRLQDAGFTECSAFLYWSEEINK